MTDEDIYAFNAVPRPAAPATRRRRLWPWLLGGALLVLLLAVAGGVALLGALIDAGRDGWHVTIDGDEWHGGWWQGVDGLLALVGVAGGLFIALLTVLLVVPLTLTLVALGLALGVGGVALALGLVVALLLSPLWALLLVLWLLLRKRPAATVSA